MHIAGYLMMAILFEMLVLYEEILKVVLGNRQKENYILLR